MWEVIETENGTHIIPESDLREHTSTWDCWCDPSEDVECEGVAVHHSLDKREFYETGKLKVS